MMSKLGYTILIFIVVMGLLGVGLYRILNNQPSPKPIPNAELQPTQSKPLSEPMPEEELGEIEEAVKKLKNSDFNTAIEIFQQSIEDNPNALEGYIGLANTYSEKGEYGKAVDYWQLARKLDPDNRDVCLGLAFSFEKAKDYRNAADELERYLKLEPNHPRKGKLQEIIKKYRDFE